MVERDSARRLGETQVVMENGGEKERMAMGRKKKIEKKKKFKKGSV